jgi:hypothetical protein
VEVSVAEVSEVEDLAVGNRAVAAQEAFKP